MERKNLFPNFAETYYISYCNKVQIHSVEKFVETFRVFVFSVLAARTRPPFLDSFRVEKRKLDRFFNEFHKSSARFYAYGKW